MTRWCVIAVAGLGQACHAHVVLLLPCAQVVFEKAPHVLAQNIRKGGLWLPYILDQGEVDERTLAAFKANYKNSSSSCVGTSVS